MQIAAVKFLQMTFQKSIPQVLQQQLVQTVWILKKYLMSPKSSNSITGTFLKA